MKNKPKHNCEFLLKSKTLDILYPPDLKFAKFRRKFREFCLISEENGRRCFTPMGTAGYIFEKEKQLTQHPLAIHPHSKFCQYWESIVMIEICLSLFFRPFFISQFSWEAFMTPAYQVLALLGDIFETTDLVLHFMIGYVDRENQTVVLELPKIFSYNVQTFRFYINLLGSLPLELFVYLFAVTSGTPHAIFLSIVFLKIFHLHTFFRYFMHMGKIYNWKEPTKYIVFTCISMVLTHQWLTCVFYYGVLSDHFRNTDANDFIIVRAPLCRHLIVMYMVCNTFLYEVGFYSYFTIETKKDQLIFSAVVLASNFLCILYVGVFIQFLGLVKTSRIQYEELLQEVRKFLSQENLPKHVHLKVEKHFRFRFQNKYFRETIILDTLSPTLKREIASFLCLKLILDEKSLFKDLPVELAKSLCLWLTFESFLPGDEIIRVGKKAKKMYFVYSGSGAAYSPTGREMFHVYDGQQFGASTFVTNSSYVLTIMALEMTECYVLTNGDFLTCLAAFPEHCKVVINAATKQRKFIKGLYPEVQNVF